MTIDLQAAFGRLFHARSGKMAAMRKRTNELIELLRSLTARYHKELGIEDKRGSQARREAAETLRRGRIVQAKTGRRLLDTLREYLPYLPD